MDSGSEMTTTKNGPRNTITWIPRSISNGVKTIAESGLISKKYESSLLNLRPLTVVLLRIK